MILSLVFFVYVSDKVVSFSNSIIMCDIALFKRFLQHVFVDL